LDCTCPFPPFISLTTDYADFHKIFSLVSILFCVILRFFILTSPKKEKRKILKFWFLLLSFAYRLYISLIATAASTNSETSATMNPSGVITGTGLGVGVGVGVIVGVGVGVGVGPVTDL